jgi:uncharacterized protein (DUF1778 family)
MQSALKTGSLLPMASPDGKQHSRRGSENRQRQALIAARVDPHERQQVREAAARAGQPVATFIRAAVLRAAAESWVSQDHRPSLAPGQ